MSAYTTDDGLEVIDPYADEGCYDEEQENVPTPVTSSLSHTALKATDEQRTVLTNITNTVDSPPQHKADKTSATADNVSVLSKPKSNAFTCLMQASTTHTNSKKRALAATSNTLAVPAKKRASMSTNNSTKLKSEQLYLDAGQRDLGATRCTTCGLTYFKGEPSDEQMHAVIHKPYVEGITFANSLVQPSMVALSNSDNSRILRITAAASNDALRSKVTEILAMANAELGGASDSSTLDEQQTMFVYVKQHKVHGMIVVSRIASAVSILAAAADTTDVSDDTASLSAAPASTKAAAANDGSDRLLGIDKMWTHVKFRRHGVAVALIDAARQHFVYGCSVTRQQVAFSHPTRAGRVFAEKFTGLKNFLTYS